MPHPTRARDPRRFGSIRWRWVARYWVVQALAVPVVVLIVGSGPFWNVLDLEVFLDPDYWVLCGLIIGTITASQAALLAPVGSARISAGSRGWSILRQLGCGFALSSWAAWVLYGPLPLVIDVVATDDLGSWPDLSFDQCMVFVVVVGAACALALRAWYGSRAPVLATYIMAVIMASALVLGLLWAMLEAVELLTGGDVPATLWVVASLAVVLPAWYAGWVIVNRFASRRSPESFVSRVAGVLLAGTVIEAVLATPIDVMVRRRMSCYCAEGTFWTWVVALTAGFIALGPFVILLPVSKRRRRRSRKQCVYCGYDRRGLSRDASCPECGRPRLARLGAGPTEQPIEPG